MASAAEMLDLIHALRAAIGQRLVIAGAEPEAARAYVADHLTFLVRDGAAVAEGTHGATTITASELTGFIALVRASGALVFAPIDEPAQRR